MKANTCKHFNGIQNDTCDKGIGYDKFRDGVRPVLFTFPCFGKCDPGGCTSNARKKVLSPMELDLSVDNFTDAYEPVPDVERKAG